LPSPVRLVVLEDDNDQQTDAVQVLEEWPDGCLGSVAYQALIDARQRLPEVALALEHKGRFLCDFWARYAASPPPGKTFAVAEKAPVVAEEVVPRKHMKFSTKKAEKRPKNKRAKKKYGQENMFPGHDSGPPRKNNKHLDGR
jgi:hypothetical protein